MAEPAGSATYLEHYSDGGRRIIQLAADEAKRLYHNYIGSEHLLLGLLKASGSVSARVLAGLGVSLEVVRGHVEEIIGRGPSWPVGHLPYTPRAKRILEGAVTESRTLRGPVDTEHILLSLIRVDDGVASQVLARLGVTMSQIHLATLARIDVQLPAQQRRADAPEPSEPLEPPPTVDRDAPWSSPLLEQFGQNLARAAREDRLDPVVGRERELDRLVQVLSRRTRNNPVLIGEPGVGKTAVVEGLAQRIVRGEVPPTLRAKQLYRLNLETLAAEAQSHGQAERRLNEIRAEIRDHHAHLLVFVEDVEVLFGAPAGRASAASTMIRSMVVGREVQVIATGSIDAFRRGVRADPRLAGVLQDVMVAPPTPTAAHAMLAAARDRYEHYHRVSITDAAIVEAVQLADRYFHDRYLPATAIDLIDEASAQLRVTLSTKPPDLRDLTERLARLRRDKEAAIDAQDSEPVRLLLDREKQLLRQMAQREKEWQEGVLEGAPVDAADIRTVVEQRLKERIDEESAAPTAPDQPQSSVHTSVFPPTDDVWMMS